MSAFNVFALTRQAVTPFELAGHRVELVDAGGVFAAVERIAERPRVSEAALRAQHDVVMRLSADVDELLPARFGSFVDEDELRQVLALRRKIIDEALDLVRGRVQMTVRLKEDAPASSGPAPALTTTTNGTAYLEARRAAAAPRLPIAATALSAAVGHLVVAERADRSPGINAASIYHLLAKKDVRRYTAAIVRLDAPDLSLSGPWPPFAFAPDLWV
jgi:hypothetical protein